MQANQEASVERLNTESERARRAHQHGQRIARQASDTAADLKAKVSPENIKHELRHFVSETKQNMFQSLEDKVRENPLQAVAVGAAVAYPLWGILRTIPGPLMLVGVGLWLASKSGRRSDRAGAGSRARDDAQRRRPHHSGHDVGALGRRTAGGADVGRRRAGAIGRLWAA